MRIEELRKLVDDHFDREEFLNALECSVELMSQHAGELTFDDIFKKGLCHFKVVGMAPDFGGFTIHDPVNNADYSVERFLSLHHDVQELPVDILTCI